MYPEEKLEVEKCKICGEPVKPAETSTYTSAESVLDKFKEELEKDKEKMEEKLESGSSKLAKMEDGELTLEIEDGEVAESIEEVDEISLKVFGREIGRIKNPDYAEFPNIQNVEKAEDGVELHFQSPQEKEVIDKIESLRKQMDKGTVEE